LLAGFLLVNQRFGGNLPTEFKQLANVFFHLTCLFDPLSQQLNKEYDGEATNKQWASQVRSYLHFIEWEAA
jgi:hypothetical protein